MGRFSIEAIFSAKDRMGRVIGRIESRMGRWHRKASVGLRAMDKHLDKVGAGLRRVGVAAGAAAAAGALIGSSLLQTGAGFEQAITDVGAVMLKARDQIGDLEAKALELGSTTKFTATEAANSMEIMARAGFKNSEILSGVDGVLSAAAASGLELAEVANHVSNALKGMGLETKEAGRVSDVLALASARTNSSIGTLGESIRNVASTARQLKVPFEQVTAGVALLQDVGLDASVAGSAMNTMLTKMAKPMGNVEKQMKKFGISFKDARGNMLPFQDVLAQLDKAGKKAGGTFDKVAFFADLVGLRGQKAAANLADLFESGKFQKLAEELKNAKGSAAAMAKIRMDTLHGDWLLFKSAVDGVKVALFDLEGGPLRTIVQDMTEWVTANKALIVQKVEKWVKDFKKALPALIDEVKTAAGAAYDFVDSLDLTVADIVSAVKWFGRLVAAYVALSAAVKAAQVVMLAYKGVTAAVTAAKWLYTKATAAATLATKADTVANVANKASLAGMMGKLKGFGPLLGKAGLLGAAAAVGYAFGTWIDKLTGASKKLADMMSSTKWLNTAVRDFGRWTGIKAIEEVGQGNLDRQKAREEIGASSRRGASAAAATPARVTEDRRVTESSSREQVDVVIHDDTGRATVKRKGGRGSGAAINLQPTGAM